VGCLHVAKPQNLVAKTASGPRLTMLSEINTSAYKVTLTAFLGNRDGKV
jgi:hypothetical protein